MSIAGDKINIDNFLSSKNYEDSLDIITKQNKGIYYTPKNIVNYIIKKTLKNHDIVKNPYPKVLDISCGCGNFLLEAYDILYDMFEENIYDLKDKYNDDYWKIDNIHNHIISNCIYGVDIDEKALEILKNSLIQKDEDLEIKTFNLYCEDSLKKDWNEKFDYIIGNPPYIGHKKMDKDYKKFLLKKYSKTYKDKSDIYYCFYEKINELLKSQASASIITPRYFLESPSGENLRKYLKNNTNINEIVDFSGACIFENVGVCATIITFEKNIIDDNNIDIYKCINENINLKDIDNIDDLIKSEEFEFFKVNQNKLEDEWIILNECEKDLYNKIKSKCDYELKDIADSFQGIITGCDKAFVLKNNNKQIKKIDKDILKPWVKNKNISKYIINQSDYKLIYSNDIKEENDYQFEIDEFIKPYKEKLSNRRECKKNTRKWYQLQWGREKYLFEQIKIMYPYKCKENRFAIDYENNFCSADVYSFFIKEKYKQEFSYEYLVGILNSSTYDRYYKMNAKKMSKNLYDYYPNKVMKIHIFKDENYKEIEQLSKQIIKKLKQNEVKEINLLQNKIDYLVHQSFNL